MIHANFIVSRSHLAFRPALNSGAKRHELAEVLRYRKTPAGVARYSVGQSD